MKLPHCTPFVNYNRSDRVYVCIRPKPQALADMKIEKYNVRQQTLSVCNNDLIRRGQTFNPGSFFSGQMIVLKLFFSYFINTYWFFSFIQVKPDALTAVIWFEMHSFHSVWCIIFGFVNSHRIQIQDSRDSQLHFERHTTLILRSWVNTCNFIKNK